jgi:hypothetical protein
VKRRLVVIDRLSCAVLGGALIAAGAAAVAWERGDLPVPVGGVLRIPALPAVVDAAWWPFALGAAAIVVTVLGLVWLFSHRPGQTLGDASLPDSTPGGLLTVDLDTAASAAATHLARRPHIASATGTTMIDRGQRVIELDVKLESGADGLAASAPALEATRRDLANALDGVPFKTRILLRLPRHPRGNPRVA